MQIGLLAASRIAVPAVIEPSASVGVRVAAVGARSLDRARDYAQAHGIERAYGSYEDLLADKTLDAIYIGTPNSLHAEWTIAALEAGHHVLCEKPLAGNAADARRMVETAHRTGRTLMEAFHWRFHRYASELIDVVARLVRPLAIETEFVVPNVPKDNIRYQYGLGGGALMDLGCYNVHWIRTLLGEPSTIDAEMDVTVEGVDDTTRATLGFEDGSTARIIASFAGDELSWYLNAIGQNGHIEAQNPLAPQRGNKLTWNIDGRSGDEEVGGPSSYQAQLRAFVAIVTEDADQLVTHKDSINNMIVVDEMYHSAGLDPRP